MVAACDNKIDFKSQRIERSSAFKVKATVEIVFPLFGPIKEKLWAAGWNPEIIYSTTQDVEERMVFKTVSSYREPEPYIWMISQYQPDKYLIAYTVSTSNRIWIVTVQCESEEDKTKVMVTYSYTGLTPEGNRINEIALKEMYEHNLTDWQEAINYYLETGSQMQ
jgi:hypothetical protein